MIPVDKAILVVESWKDIVIRFNGDPYKGRSRFVPSQKGYKSAKCCILENVSFRGAGSGRRGYVRGGDPVVWAMLSN